MTRVVTSAVAFVSLYVAIWFCWDYVCTERVRLESELEQAKNALEAERELARRTAESYRRMEAVNDEQRRKIETYARKLAELARHEAYRDLLDLPIPDELVDGLHVCPPDGSCGDSGVASGGDGGSGHAPAGDGAKPSDTLSHP